MSRLCELSGKGVMTGNNVSHAKNRTRRRFLPNLCNVSLASDKLNQTIRLKVSAHALRSVEHLGGLDNYLIKAKNSSLSAKARKLKKKNMNTKLLTYIFLHTLEVLNSSSNSPANCSVIAPPNCSASTIVTALL